MASYRVGPLEADTDQFQLRIEGRTVELSPRVFDACVLFCRHPDRVLTKQELLDTLWPQTVVTESSLFKVVQELRRAIAEAGCDTVTIENVPGRGYRLSWARIDHDTETASVPVANPRGRAPWLLGALAGTVVLAIWLYTPPKDEPALPLPDPARIEALIASAPAEALDELQRMGPAADPDWFELQRGRALLRLGRIDEALAALDAALANPELDPAQAVRVLQSLSTALDHAGRAGEIFNRIEARFPEPAQRPAVLDLLLGNAAQELGRFEQAQALFEGVARRAEAEADSALLQHALGSLGTLAARSGDIGQARRYFLAALDLALDRLDVRMAAALQTNLGNLEQEDGQLDTAARYYAQAYQVMLDSADGPTLAQILLNFANVHLEAGKYEVADYYYARLIDWADRRGQVAVAWMARLNGVLSGLRQGHNTRAAADARLLLERLGPDAPPDLRALAHAVAARAFAAAGEPLRALDQLRQLEELGISASSIDVEVQAALGRGIAEIQLDQHERAERSLLAGLAVNGPVGLRDRFDLLEQRVLALAALGRMDQARADQARAAELQRDIERAGARITLKLDQPFTLPD